MLLGEKIKAARELGGISMRELDRLAGVREGVTWKVETSKTGNAETKTLAKLARVLFLNLEYLVNDVGGPPTEEEVRAAIARARQPAPGEAPAVALPVHAAPAPVTGVPERVLELDDVAGDEKSEVSVVEGPNLVSPPNAPSSNPPPGDDAKPASVRIPRLGQPVQTPDPDGAI